MLLANPKIAGLEQQDLYRNQPPQAMTLRSGIPFQIVGVLVTAHKFCCTGLESDEEDGVNRGTDSAQAEESPKSRSKRKKVDGSANETPDQQRNGNIKDLFGDSEDEDETLGAKVEEEQPSRMRNRNAQLFGDSDDE